MPRKGSMARFSFDYAREHLDELVSRAIGHEEIEILHSTLGTFRLVPDMTTPHPQQVDRAVERFIPTPTEKERQDE